MKKLTLVLIGALIGGPLAYLASGYSDLSPGLAIVIGAGLGMVVGFAFASLPPLDKESDTLFPD
ncbi:MAG: hypothetical protein GC199_08670 [Alphaproteobacteria bacterium]|nr:hypothetical protein [Alphaproteobacteria bacterium]